MDPDIFLVKREGCDCGVSSALIELLGRTWQGGIGNLLAIVSHCAIKPWQGGASVLGIVYMVQVLGRGASVSYLELYHIVQFVSLKIQHSSDKWHMSHSCRHILTCVA